MLRENSKPQPVPGKAAEEAEEAALKAKATEGKENSKEAKKGAASKDKGPDKAPAAPKADKKADKKAKADKKEDKKEEKKADKKEEKEKKAATKRKAADKEDAAPAPASAPAVEEPAQEKPVQEKPAKKSAKTGKKEETVPAKEEEKEEVAAAAAPEAKRAKKADSKTADDKAADQGEEKKEKKAAAPKKAPKKAEDKAGPKKAATTSKKAAKGEVKKEAETVAEDVEMEEAEVKEEEGEEGRRRAATGPKSYKEGGAGLRLKKSEMIEVKEEGHANTEANALEETGGPKGGARRRLVDFAVHDAEGGVVGLERALLLPTPCTLSGAIYPSEGELVKEAGRRVEGRFGPLREWRLEFPHTTAAATGAAAKKGAKAAEARPVVLIKTAAALYEAVRPASSYRSTWTQLDEQIELAHQVYLALSPEAGGNPSASWEEVLAKLARSKVGKAYGSARDALLLNGKFVLSHLPAMSTPSSSHGKTDGKGGVALTDSLFGKALAAEVAKGPHITRAMTNGITINDAADTTADAAAAPHDALAAADEEMARRLQAKMDAQQYGAGAAAGGTGRGKGAAYIRISEQEIADDYPLPTQYVKEVEETDELLMVDPDDLAMGIHPEDLPRRTLTDFAFYNTEGFMSTLELVPMFNGVDHDVEVFGSGVVAEDDGDFTVGGVATDKASEEEQAGGSGSSGSSGGAGSAGGPKPAAAAGGEGGMRLFLSQVREWCVEVSCDMLFLTVRTDVAWYRLVKPQEKYMPWFRTVLRAARLAVRVLGMLADEARASRLSFADVVKRLAELPETDPAFVSPKPERVERFVVVHGQIILNQFSVFPNKAVQRAAFVSELKVHMETRKHHKLYMGKAKAAKGAAAKARTANPMRNRAAVGLKAKPMPATATTMVKAVWRGYFFGNNAAARAAAEAEAAEAAAAAGQVAKEVEEDENEEEEEGEEEEDALVAKKPAPKAKGAAAAGAAASAKATKPSAPLAKRIKSADIKWSGTALRKDSKGRTLYAKAKLGEILVSLGDVVQFYVEEGEVEEGEEVEPALGLVTCLYEEGSSSTKHVQVRVLLRGTETVLGDVASDEELFVTLEVREAPLSDVTGKADASRLTREWEWSKRMEHFKADEAIRQYNEAARAEGKPLRYVYRSLYRPNDGMFCTIPADMLDVAQGSFIEPVPEPVALGLMPGGASEGFIKAGVEYRVGDVLYLHPETFSEGGVQDKKKPAARKPAQAKAAAAKGPAKKKARKSKAAESEEEESEAVSSGAEEEGEEEEEEGSASEEEESEEEAAAKGGKKGKAAPAAAAAAKAKAGKKGAAAASTKKGKKGAAESEEDEEMEEAEEEEVEEEGGAKGTKRGRAPASKKAAAVDKDAAKKSSEAKKSGKAAAKKSGKEEDKSEKEEAKGDKEEEEAEQEGSEAKEGAAKKKGGRKGKHKGGANEGLKAFGLAQVVSVQAQGKTPVTVTVRRLYRAEDISSDLAYRSDWWDVYAGPLSDTRAVDVGEVVGKAAAALKGASRGVKFGDIGTELCTFRVVGSYDGKAVSAPPSSLSVTAPAGTSKAATAGKKGKKGAEKGVEEAAAADVEVEVAEEEEEESAVAMSSLDIFAGCGGLSEGMHQAGVAKCKWAVEYDQAAADAFKLNNPDAEVFCNNCNVLLRAAMAKAGVLDDCDACDDCMEAAAKLTPEYTAGLPLPGEVEFIMGGPPCQGYSGMNRFNKGNWSMVQNSMVMAYLSYADFYRPRYFLLENVRNFVSHNKSFTFRLTLRTLLSMGYQVRFGVLNAGNFGVPQSRKRTIIWAAAPSESLPAWPQPRHVFHSPQLTINLPGGVAYTAVPNAPGNGAPLRAVTVRDAIADLPQIENGHSDDAAPYTDPAVSAFQKAIRGKNELLRDHICKEMNELNLERCRCIPKNTPGADWRVLMDIVKSDPSRELYKGQPLVPWCLPNTMDRHNGWRGLFGRLDLNGHFPTSTTDPQPMGKVGQVFHPTQDRIVSVRECARSQGFPDAFRFSGNVHNRHRQVGNAVPPPLAHALGSQLRRVLDARRQAQLDAAMDQF